MSPIQRDTPSVSVVIPTYQRASSLARVLQALVDVRPPPGGFEVIVVDDGSTDDTAAVIDRTTFTRLTKPNGGAASARNLGWRAARGAVVAFTDDDVVPSPTWLTDLLPFFDDREVVAVGGQVIPMQEDRASQFVQAERLVDHARDATGRAEYLVTANMLVRRSSLEAIGGFDEGFPGAAGEDVDLSLRLRSHGRLIAVPFGAVAHDHRTSIRSLLRTYRRHGAARAELAAKHHDLDGGSAARDLLRPATWKARFERYRTATGSVGWATAFVALRLVGTINFAVAFVSARRRRTQFVADVVILNDVGAMGGGQQVTLDVARALADLGRRPLIASPRGWLAEEAARLSIDHVPFEFRARRLLTPSLRLPRPQSAVARFADVVRIRRLMSATGASGLHTVATVPHVAGALASIGAPWSLVWHLNQIHSSAIGLLPSPDAVIGASRATLNAVHWRPHLRSAGIVCPNKVDLDRFRPPTETERTDARETLGLDDGTIAALTACRLEPAKGVEELILACAGIQGLVLLVAGDTFGASNTDGYVDRLRALAEATGVTLRLLGARRDIEALLQAADIAVMASHSEGFGLFLAEAEAAAVPVVAYRVGGVGEVVEDEFSGYLVPAGDVTALGVVISHLASSARERSAMGQAGRRLAEQRFAGHELVRALSIVHPPRPPS